ncbi:MAG: hypothetical protein JW788_06535 [Candidatus Omnitrophica bacterium]|nr:hypothetical protein [Candidatus Omnitrophota bacterium]
MKYTDSVWPYVLIAFLLIAPSCCFGQGMGQRGGMQGSAQMQEFKARQQKKSQDYLAKYDKENNEFMNSVGGLGKQEKIQAFRDFLSGQYEKNCAFRQEMHDDWRAFMQGQLDKNPNMQSYMKEQMLSRIDQDYEEARDFYAGKIEEDMQFLDQLSEDKSIDGQELNVRLKEFFQAQGASGREFAQGQQEKYRNRQIPSGSGKRGYQ